MPIFVIFKKAYFQDQFAYKSDGERESFYRETDCLSACHTEVRSLDSTKVSHRDDWNSTLGAVECCFPGSLAGSWVGSGSEMMAYGYCKRSLKPLTHTTQPQRFVFGIDTKYSNRWCSVFPSAPEKWSQDTKVYLIIFGSNLRANRWKNVT